MLNHGLLNHEDRGKPGSHEYIIDLNSRLASDGGRERCRNTRIGSYGRTPQDRDPYRLLCDQRKINKGKQEAK
jgi:hypothetical protein